jgi:hypothetical protein
MALPALRGFSFFDGEDEDGGEEEVARPRFGGGNGRPALMRTISNNCR